jgi:hypothetical protein
MQSADAAGGRACGKLVHNRLVDGKTNAPHGNIHLAVGVEIWRRRECAVVAVHIEQHAALY